MNEFIKLVSDMRTAQQEYAKRITRANESRDPHDLASANLAMQVTQELEAECDESLKAFKNQMAI